MGRTKQELDKEWILEMKRERVRDIVKKVPLSPFKIDF